MKHMIIDTDIQTLKEITTETVKYIKETLGIEDFIENINDFSLDDDGIASTGFCIGLFTALKFIHTKDEFKALLDSLRNI